MSTVETKELSAPAGFDLKIAAGKTLDLHSQGTVVLPTIPSDKMPAGSVLQAVNVYSTNEVTTSTTARISLDTLILTPVGTSSKFVITFFLQAGWGNFNSGFGAYMYKDGAEIAKSGNSHSVYTNTLNDVYNGGSWSCIDSGSTAGTDITFELRVQPYNTQVIKFSKANQSRGFTILEIAQ